MGDSARRPAHHEIHAVRGKTLSRSTDNTSGLRKLSREKGAPAVDLTRLKLPLAVLDYVREDIARDCRILALREDRGNLFIAAADPNDAEAIDRLAFLSGKTIVAYAAPDDLLAEAIDEAYRAKRQGALEWRGRRVREGSDAIDLRRLNQARPAAGDVSIGDALRQIDSTVPDASEPFSSETSYRITPPRHTSGKRRPRILVVDDEEVIRKIVKQALAARGFHIVEAEGGMAALRQIKEQEPDAILLDAMLPDVHGFDICKRLNESRRYRHIPVVMMTAVYKGWRMAADLRELYGVAGFVEKPFDLHDVVQKLEAAMAGRDTSRPDAAALSEEARRLFTHATQAYKQGHLEEAIAGLARAVKIDPLNPTLRHQLGLLYAQTGQDFAAIQELEMAIELEPGRFAALKNLAILYQRRGFRRKACEYWEQALAHAPDEKTRREIKDILLQLL